jgi:hypothetical protein
LERRPRPSRRRAEYSVDGNLLCQNGLLRTFLKCSMSMVERLLRQQGLPVVEVGRKVLVAAFRREVLGGRTGNPD